MVQRVVRDFSAKLRLPSAAAVLFFLRGFRECFAECEKIFQISGWRFPKTLRRNTRNAPFLFLLSSVAKSKNWGLEKVDTRPVKMTMARDKHDALPPAPSKLAYPHAGRGVEFCVRGARRDSGVGVPGGKSLSESERPPLYPQTGHFWMAQ
ncbi:hypothetical protein CDAR_240991 [Caerostris darwini]|uniref:Uncharacterized protein n=1 Tax=Caerostris darwini TaxID=1538125 RepID=A0AAV4TDY0_9ARAC|nr:hypothetical protein CDAR_240991 [Caerostris darwini]